MRLGQRVAIGVALLAVVQLGAWWIYRTVESRRSAPSDAPFELETVSGPADALDVALERPDGTSVDLREHAGKAIALHFWASWCVPCRDELPTLLELERTFGDELVLVLVSVDEDWAPVRQFFAGDVPDSIVLDRTGALRQSYEATTLPETWVIDATGRLRARARGARDWRSKKAAERLRMLLTEDVARPRTR